jgi:hypothetical protein
MHRQRAKLVARTPARAKPLAEVVQRSGIVANYQLHDHVLSNRHSRRLYARNLPQLDDVQRRIVDAVTTVGWARATLADVLQDETLESAVLEQGVAFVADTERELGRERSENAGGLRRRPGKEFLVRAHSFDGVTLALDHAWLRACLSPRMLDLANAYLQMWAKLSYVDLWYTVPQPAEAERVASQRWHFDYDDKHLLKAFLYLRDVDTATGPFEYVAESQPGGKYHVVRPWRPMGYGRVDEDEVARRVPPDAVQTFTAPAGTIIFCNTSGLHRGGFATAAPRILATATYCSPASLAALSERNYGLDAAELEALEPPAHYAVS